METPFNEFETKNKNGGVKGIFNLKGREIRATLGSTIPGTLFNVKVSSPVNVAEKQGDAWATFSK